MKIIMRDPCLNRTLDLFEGTDGGRCVKMITFLETIEEVPRGGVAHFHVIAHALFLFSRYHTRKKSK